LIVIDHVTAFVRCDLALDISVIIPSVGRSHDDNESTGRGDCDLDKLSHGSLLGLEGKRSQALTSLDTQKGALLRETPWSRDNFFVIKVKLSRNRRRRDCLI
jgi:hypothetical protein